MPRRFERFEVKREMSDGKELRPDDKDSWKPSPEYQEEIDREANSIGFEDDKEVEIESDMDKINLKIEDDTIQQEFSVQNSQVESELFQYYDDSVTNDYLQVYLSEKLTSIYGKELSRLQVASASEMVEDFLKYNEFSGIESYRDLVQNIEDVIRIMRNNEEKAKNSRSQGNFTLPSQEETQKMIASYRNASIRGELFANAYISSQAKKLGTDKETLRTYIREQGKSQIRHPEKVLHYHRTSIESASKILESGYLLSRENIKTNGGDISHLNGSSSQNVQFSVDRYDAEGKLQSAGFDLKDNLGAASTDIVFVMSPELLKEDSYDCFGMYPTVEKANISRCCATILAKNLEVLSQLREVMTKANIQIPSILQQEFDRESILQSLSPEKTTGMRLSKVNGKSILQSGIDATKVSTRIGTINEQVKKIAEIQKSKTIQRGYNEIGLSK